MKKQLLRVMRYFRCLYQCEMLFTVAAKLQVMNSYITKDQTATCRQLNGLLKEAGIEYMQFCLPKSSTDDISLLCCCRSVGHLQAFRKDIENGQLGTVLRHAISLITGYDNCCNIKLEFEESVYRNCKDYLQTTSG